MDCTYKVEYNESYISRPGVSICCCHWEHSLEMHWTQRLVTPYTTSQSAKTLTLSSSQPIFNPTCFLQRVFCMRSFPARIQVTVSWIQMEWLIQCRLEVLPPRDVAAVKAFLLNVFKKSRSPASYVFARKMPHAYKVHILVCGYSDVDGKEALSTVSSAFVEKTDPDSSSVSSVFIHRKGPEHRAHQKKITENIVI